MNEIQNIVRTIYDADPGSEYSRIENRPEFLLTCRMLDRYIKPGDTVLDIGGGPGRYTLYLAEKGSHMTLLDLSPENVKFASERAAEKGCAIKTVVGDACEADKLTEGLFDHVLLMGPVYHLEKTNRISAVNAALSLLKPGGVIYITFINMLCRIIASMKYNPGYISTDNPATVIFMENFLAERSYFDIWSGTFYINQDEILPFMEQFPLEKLHLFGQEGIVSPCESNIMSQPKEIMDAWLDLCEKIWEREELLSWSQYLMYIGKKI